LKFFSEQLPQAFKLSLIYWAMFLAVFIIGIINLNFYYVYWRALDGGTARARPCKTSEDFV